MHIVTRPRAPVNRHPGGVGLGVEVAGGFDRWFDVAIILWGRHVLWKMRGAVARCCGGDARNQLTERADRVKHGVLIVAGLQRTKACTTRIVFYYMRVGHFATIRPQKKAHSWKKVLFWEAPFQGVPVFGPEMEIQML